MKAIYWNGESIKLNTAYAEPKCGAAEAIVRVRLAGICSTDLHIFRGYMAFRGVPGHELVGEVEEGSAELVGKRVVAEINFACGRCESCRQGRKRHCPNRRVMGILDADGVFSEKVSVPIGNLHLVPEDVSDDEAVFTEPLAAAFEILEQVHVEPGTRALVLGDGKLGLLCAQVLALAGANVTAVGKHPRKLDLLRARGISAAKHSEWHPALFDLVVEATGSTSGLKMAIEATRPMGTLVLKSTVAGEHHLSLAPLVINEITVIGSRCGPFAPALRALTQKSVCVTPLIDKVYPLSDGIEAIEHAARPGTMKILLAP